MFQPHNETGDLWKLENMVKTVAFLKPNGKINVYAVVLHLHYANDQRH